MKMENLISLNTFLIENQILTDNYRKCMQKVMRILIISSYKKIELAIN